jgi:hypothetical protein
LIALVSRQFKKAARITPESSKRLEQVHYEHQLIGMPLGTGEIIDWKLSSPSTMNRAQEYTVSATVKGEGDYFFITLLLVDPDKNQQWFVDNETINLELDTGKLNLEPNKEYSNSWTFPIFADAKVGEYIAFLGLYQDTIDLPTINRRLVDYKQQTIKVI